MALHIAFRNPQTDEVRHIKLGWSWSLYNFSIVFGLPLFWRGLYLWGGLIVAIWAVVLASLALIADGEHRFTIAMGAIAVMLGVDTYLAMRGNELTAKRLLQKGWEFAEQDPLTVKIAKKEWGIG